VRPWSTVICIPTNEGPVWFKAGNAAQAFEGGVIQILARRRPDLVPTLLAVDVDRGWMLQTDGGTLLRGVADGTDHGVWIDILRRYAELQIDVADEREALLAAGAPDRRLTVLPEQFEQLLDDRESLRFVTDEEVERLRALSPRIRDECSELASFSLPETIQHDDLHDGQVFVRDGRYVFFDWGDACLSHPFFTLTVTLAVLAHRLDVAQDAPELERFRDAYLEPWTRFAARTRLEEAFVVANRLGVLCRGLTWVRIVNALRPPLPEEDLEAVPERMRMLLRVYA
jgi:Phosphotransferase enzyme family